MRVLDLFSGLRGWSDPWLQAGHQVRTLDFDARFKADFVMPIHRFASNPTRFLDMYVDKGWRPDVILASPPCDAFTVMRIGTNWTKDHRPKTMAAVDALGNVLATQIVVNILKPRYFVLENPRAKMRRIVELYWPELDRRTVTYCQYGEDRMKPTDLWSPAWPAGLELHPTCRNGDMCHTRAPRGSKTGTQGGLSGELSAKIPLALSVQIMNAIEEDARARTQATA